jgi:hypothetical protein
VKLTSIAVAVASGLICFVFPHDLWQPTRRIGYRARSGPRLRSSDAVRQRSSTGTDRTAPTNPYLRVGEYTSMWIAEHCGVYHS